MIGILFAKFQLFRRRPATFILMTIISIIFAYAVGLSGQGKVEIPVYTSLSNVDELLSELNESESFSFVISTKEDAENKVRGGRANAAVELFEDGYTIIRSTDETNIPLINNELRLVYAKKLQNESVIAQTDEQEEVKSILKQAEEAPVFKVKHSNFKNDHEKVYDNRLFSIFGFSLFFVIYTIGNNVYHIMEEKENRIWDRLIYLLFANGKCIQAIFFIVF